jgi:hypothetical protein
MNEMTRKTDQKKVLQWRCTKTPLDYFEAACCIAGMINTITGQTFGSYLFDEFGLQVMEEIEL